MKLLSAGIKCAHVCSERLALNTIERNDTGGSVQNCLEPNTVRFSLPISRRYYYKMKFYYIL